jgi:release factor glutamine methyltransferase
MRIHEALAQAQAASVERLDAQRLLQHLLQQGRAWLLAHDDEVLSAAQVAAWQALLARRAAGEPLAYLTGERDFHGLPLRVSPAVLVPRPDTETLVGWALDLLAGALADHPAPQVADLGTGSGAIALAVKHACPRAEVRASDASELALAVARDNGQLLALHITWLRGHWWRPFRTPPLHVALSNPPYIEAGDPHLPALRHEPLSALVPPDGDGLSSLREIVAGAGAHLAPDAWLLLEHGHDQADSVAALLQAAGFVGVQHRVDLGGHRRCTGGRWPSAT